MLGFYLNHEMEGSNNLYMLLIAYSNCDLKLYAWLVQKLIWTKSYIDNYWYINLDTSLLVHMVELHDNIDVYELLYMLRMILHELPCYETFDNICKRWKVILLYDRILGWAIELLIQLL